METTLRQTQWWRARKGDIRDEERRRAHTAKAQWLMKIEPPAMVDTAVA